MTVFTSSGTLTVPEDNYYALKAWGAGGSNSIAGDGGAGGGGGGAFSYIVVFLTAGDYDVIVGEGGGFDDATSTWIHDGGDTYLQDASNNVIVLAEGGKGVFNDTTGDMSGGQGGLAANCIGDTAYDGGSGGDGSVGDNHAGAGGGGSAFDDGPGSNGQNGSSTTPGAGGDGEGPGGDGGEGESGGIGAEDGVQPGGGAGGKGNFTSGAHGGDGTLEAIVVENVDAVTPVATGSGSVVIPTADAEFNFANVPTATASGKAVNPVFGAPPVITVTAHNPIGYIIIDITNPEGFGSIENSVYRRRAGDSIWTRIAKSIPNNGTYYDAMARIGIKYEYYVKGEIV